MYSRKDGISIPKNYNGVRFKNSPEPMVMKEHRPIYRQEVKSAHSPLYNTENTESESPAFRENFIPPEDIYVEKGTLTQDFYDPKASSDAENEEDGIHNSSEPETEDKVAEVSKCDSSLLSSLRLPVSGILNSINREDALLLGLIILMSSEQSDDNSLILTFLALLLLKK